MKTKIPPPILLVLTGAVMWLVAHSPFAFSYLIPYSSATAVVLVVLGVLTDVLSILQFRSAETTVNPLKPEAATALVRTGIFKRSRNPMYVGLLLILTGWMVWLGSLSNVLVLLVFFLLITELQIKPEEVALRRLFGHEYDDYCRQVRRWV